jgi:O-antigen/teichoic acid export membrane protein
MEKGDLKKIRSGGIWTAAGAVAGVLSQLLIMLSLALFLEPGDVGLFTVFLFVLSLGITSLPLGNDFSFVQADHLTRGDVYRLAAISALLAVCGMIIAASTSLFLEPTSARIASTVVFGLAAGYVEAIFLILSASLQRGLQYKNIEKANIVRQLLTLALSICLLAITHKVEAAFAGRILSGLVGVGLLFRPVTTILSKGKPTQPVMSAVAKDMLLKNVLGSLSQNAEVVAASPQLGVAGLGIYDFGRRIVAQPRDFIGSIIFKFSYPMFTKIGRISDVSLQNRFMRRVYRNVVTAASFFGFPVFASAILLASPLIPEIFGAEWSDAALIVQIFACTAFLQVLGNNIITSALTAIGGSRAVLQAEYIFLVPRLVCVFVASMYGPIAVATTMAVFILGKLGWMQWQLNRRSALNFGLVATAVRPIALATATGLLLAFPLKVLGGTSAASVLACVIFGAVYVLGLYFLPSGPLRRILSRISRVRGKRVKI